MHRDRVIIETPYAGDVDRNVTYAKQCVRESILYYHESPIASHIMYAVSGILSELTERDVGVECGFSWIGAADKMVVYIDLGISPGMERAIKEALEQGLPVERRRIGGPAAPPLAA